MNRHDLLLGWVFYLMLAGASSNSLASDPSASSKLSDERRGWVRQIASAHGLHENQVSDLENVLATSIYIGPGNSSITQHPMTEEVCKEKLRVAAVEIARPEFERICGAPFMAPLFNPATERPEEAKACIDQLEFPNLPCTYPWIWTRANEAAALCQAMGKRLCDAHEWEGACAGALEPPDYRFELARGASPAEAVARMRSVHNRQESGRRTWSYGPERRTGICAMGSFKSPGCDGGNWQKCGSNTYPAGAFPECRSPLGVYDLHGNAAEHMNLPLAPEQMASRGSQELGVTEMKGSWFIFDSFQAHEDWCRWRAPYWHGSRVLDPKSHHNYHLGFRCCATLDSNRDSEKESEP